MSETPSPPSPPRLLLTVALAWLLLAVLFGVTGPWRIGVVLISRWEVIILLGFVAAGLVLILHRASRAFAAQVLDTEIHLSRAHIALLFSISALLLVRTTVAKFHALEVNAWDFSLYFDRPIEATLRGRLLWSEYIGMPTLGNHCGWLLLAFVPLYAIAATPYWLVIAQALAIAAAGVAAFFLFRALDADDFIAVTLALVFVLNHYTAKAVQYVFHIEIFYPLGLFVLFYAFIKRRWVLFAVALLLTLSIKEDAIVPLSGFVLTAAVVYRRWRVAAATIAVSLAVFLVDYFVVLPHFSGQTSSAPWYSGYWGSYGASPLEAAPGLLLAPLRVVSRVGAGALELFASFALVPLAGFQWLLAALPPLLVYGSSDFEMLRSFALYYSMPLLPAIFAALPDGLRRIARLLRPGSERRRRRLIAVIVLVVSVAMGSGYELDAPRGERHRIRPLVESSRAARLLIQGSLMPHAGYDDKVRVLDRPVPSPDGTTAYLLCSDCNPYPFTAAEIRALETRLARDDRYAAVSAGAVMRFTPHRDLEIGTSPRRLP
ncbi:MAG TPA: DUF2079 domain-containing protein [Thermoanaerobaculia bacterium]|nr:DUF2079 domain-containing protein [Thermoanaerobaculia bacterium]